MAIISVSHLKKTYQVSQKDPGLSGVVNNFLHPKYSQVKAVDDISFSVSAGELVGFIGPNGAGKTTTLKILSGLLYPTSGEVNVLGYVPWKREPAFQKQLSLVLGQKNQLWWDLPAQESFVLNKEIYGVSDTQYSETLSELVDLLEVKDFLKTQVRKLSLGQRMRMELIAALIHSPQVLFLDEPTIGLDVVMQKKIRGFIKYYNQKFHSTILLTSHYMDDVRELCKRIIIINSGKIIFDGKLEKIVHKFADHKLITVVFDQKINKSQLASLGDIKNFSFPKAEISVSRKDISVIAARLLQEFPVADLNIEEPSIEDIIREVFSQPERSPSLTASDANFRFDLRKRG